MRVTRLGGAAIADVLGIQVSRATAALPQTTNHALFTITGRVLLTGIVGEVTTVIQTQANNTKLLLDATAGGNTAPATGVSAVIWYK